MIQALYHRARRGEAQAVDTSILNAGLLVASMASLRPDGEPLPRPHLDGMQLGLDALYRLYETADGWVAIAAWRDDHWRALLDAFDLAHAADDDRFVDAAARAASRTELEAVLEPQFRARTAADVFALLDGRGVPCEVADGHFCLGIDDDPELREHGYVVDQDHPKVGRMRHFGTTIHFSDTPGRIWGPPPVCGQHTAEILREHDFGADEIEALVASGAVFEELWVDER